jgi:dihydroflavonol-4-reductase
MKILVTGANGHVGFGVCKALLAQGHQVRASIRSSTDAAKAAPLRALGIDDIVGLDVRKLQPFVEACRGVDVLIHVAATFAMHVATLAETHSMLRDSTEGATNAVRAAAEAGVPKVVLTSSVAALPRVGPDDPPVTEADWATDLAVPYFRAKTEGERAAWKAARETAVRLVTLLPGTVGGPDFHRRTPTLSMIESIMLGAMRLGAPNTNIAYVDVRDVAAAHVLAAERDVSGRFIIANDHPLDMRELSLLMHRADPSVPPAPAVLPDFVMSAGPALDWLRSSLFGTPRMVSAELVETMRGKLTKVSNERAKAELGWRQSIALDQSLADTMAAIRALRRREGHRRFI